MIPLQRFTIFPVLSIILSLILSSCEKDTVLIPGLQPTYTIEEVVVQGQILQKITGSINQSITLSNSNDYLLSGIVFVEDTLTIEPGTIIYAATGSLSALVVNRGASLLANGTAASPIVFTSENELQSTSNFGDWGGLHINGQASINSRSSGLEALIGKYGRTDGAFNDEDNSGNITYVRVEYAGKDMNGSSGAFNLNGVGNSTMLEYIQLYKSRANGIRFRGGTARIKHVLSTQSIGNGFRWGAGWRGFGQYWVVNYPEATNDTLTAIEGRSGALDNPPISAPVISNITIVGLGPSSNDPQIRGIRFRDSTHGKIYNSLITRCRRGVRADNSQPFIDAGTLVFAHNNLFNNSPDYYTGTTSDAGSFQDSSFNNTNNIVTMNGYIGADPGNSFPITSISNWFDNVAYKGAVRAGIDWTTGWTK
jgi:hypothetical protein